AASTEHGRAWKRRTEAKTCGITCAFASPPYGLPDWAGDTGMHDPVYACLGNAARFVGPACCPPVRDGTLRFKRKRPERSARVPCSAFCAARLKAPSIFARSSFRLMAAPLKSRKRNSPSRLSHIDFGRALPRWGLDHFVRRGGELLQEVKAAKGVIANP